MKKYSMLIATVLLLLLTLTTYALENNNQVPSDLQFPTLDLSSAKYGKIKNMVWLSNFVSGDKALLFATVNDKTGLPTSSLYYFNIDSSKPVLIGVYPAHPNLNNVILFAGDSIITASAHGIVRIDIQQNDKGNLNPRQEFIDIKGFEQATSMDYKGTLFYAKDGDPLLYAKTLSQDFFSGFIMNNNKTPDEMTFFRKPSAIVNANSLDRILTYLSLEQGRYNLYGMGFNGSPATKFNLPVVKDVINAKAVEDGYGFIGFKASQPEAGNQEQSLNLFMARRYPAEGKNVVILDTVPYYTDPLGAVPALDSTTYNEEYTLVYTVYDQNNKGEIKVCSNHLKPQTIVEGEKIFGPVRIARKDSGGSGRTPFILYFTQEYNQVRIKICDLEGKLIKDITDALLGE